MALYMNRNDKRTDLQERVAAELRAKSAERAKVESQAPDGVSDSNFVKDYKTTTSLAWAWVTIFLVGAGIFIWLALEASQSSAV